MKKIRNIAALTLAASFFAFVTGCSDSYKDDEAFGQAALAAEQNAAIENLSENEAWKSAEFFVVAKCGAGGVKFPVMYEADEADITAVSLKVISSKKINVLQPFLNDGWKQGSDAIDTEAGKWVTVTSSDSAVHKGAGVQVYDSAAEGIYVFGIKDFKVTTSSGTKTITASDLDKNCNLSWGGNNVYAKIQKNENKVVDENEKALSDLQDEVEKLKGELEKMKLPAAVQTLKSAYSDAAFFINVQDASDVGDETENKPKIGYDKENGTKIKKIEVSVVGTEEWWLKAYCKPATASNAWGWADNGGANNAKDSWGKITYEPEFEADVTGCSGGGITWYKKGKIGSESVAFAVKDFVITYSDGTTLKIDASNVEDYFGNDGKGKVTAYAN